MFVVLKKQRKAQNENCNTLLSPSPHFYTYVIVSVISLFPKDLGSICFLTLLKYKGISISSISFVFPPHLFFF